MDNNTKVDSVLTEEKSPMMFDERMAKTQMCIS